VTERRKEMREALREVGGVSRRAVLRMLGLAGVSAAAGPLVLGAPGSARGQGSLGALQPEEKVDATMRRLFGSRPVKDGAGVIKLEAPLIAENGAVVPITVEVQSPMTPTNYVKSIYIVSDKNRRPLNARFRLTPEAGAASIGANLRLGETTDVRAIAELTDGTLLMVKREVKVTVGGCGG
jgi:sulfur-oxidizing protein SoxY